MATILNAVNHARIRAEKALNDSAVYVEKNLNEPLFYRAFDIIRKKREDLLGAAAEIDALLPMLQINGDSRLEMLDLRNKLNERAEELSQQLCDLGDPAYKEY